MLETLTDFLKDRKQGVVLNGQNVSWANVEAGVPQGSILGPLLFLIYINDLPDNLSTNVKLFTDDTSLFSVVHNITASSCDLNDDLNRVREWPFQWKMSFNPEPSKQAQEVIFTRKLQKKDYPLLYFNDSSVKETCEQKHLGMLLDFRFDFQEHWKSLLQKVNKTVALLHKFQNILPRLALLTFYKCFVGSHLDYCDIIYDEVFNNSFHQKIESLKYNAALAFTGAIRGTSREKSYQELGLESLQQRRWYRKLCLFFKIYKNQCSKHLFDIIPQSNCQYRTRNAQNIPHINVKHQLFKNSYFPSTIIEWNKLNSNIRNSETLNIFKSKILEFLRPTANSIFGCHNPVGVKLLTRLRLGLSHLREHKFKHGFQDKLNPLCSFGKEVETTFQFLLSCPNYSDERLTLLSKIRNINPNILENTNSQITQLFLYGDKNFTTSTNFVILSSTIEYIRTTLSFIISISYYYYFRY